MALKPVVEPVSAEEAERIWEPHYSRVTNMKRTLAHVPRALHAFMEWYPLRDRAAEFLGERATNVYVHAISTANDCLICSTFFRRILIEAGEDPEHLRLDEREQVLVELARALVRDANTVPPAIFDRLASYWSKEQVVLLVAFGGLMIATNIFASAMRVELDDYLKPYARR
jgi:alkylhydroperoxidase family enzyme